MQISVNISCETLCACILYTYMTRKLELLVTHLRECRIVGIATRRSPPTPSAACYNSRPTHSSYVFRIHAEPASAAAARRPHRCSREKTWTDKKASAFFISSPLATGRRRQMSHNILLRAFPATGFRRRRRGASPAGRGENARNVNLIAGPFSKRAPSHTHRPPHP